MRGGKGTVWSEIEGRAGGAVFVFGTNLRIDHCVITACSSLVGGGIACIGTSQCPAGLEARQCTIDSCMASNWGGGLYGIHSSLQVTESSLRRNACGFEGAGCSAIDCMIEYSQSKFLRNSGQLGGIVVNGCTGSIESCEFSHNISSLDGGAADLTCSNSNVHVISNIFASSQASEGLISFCCFPDAEVRFIGNIVEHTVGNGEAAILIAGIEGDFSYNIINALSGFRHTIYAFQQTSVRFHHNFFSNNVNDVAILSQGPDFEGSLDSNWIAGNSGPCFDDPVMPAESMDVRLNWWGHQTGPYHVILNPNGQGDTLGWSMAMFEPWLQSPPDTSLSSNSSEVPAPVQATWRILSLFPNPFNNVLKVELAGFAGSDFSIAMFDLLGRQIMVFRPGRVTGGAIQLTLPQKLSSGIYFFMAYDGTFSETRKVVLLK